MILKTFLKQPSELKDYDVSYVPWLEPINDTLDEVDVIVTCETDPSNTSLEFIRSEITTTLFKLWLKGGTPDYVYKVTLRASTVGGRIDESELYFAIGEI